MHPPLDRPHPDCQEEIDSLRSCHASNSKLKFWACNDVKFALDQCFKEEKRKMLEEMNKDFDVKRKREDDAFKDAVGHTMSFEEYLKNDQEYNKELKKAQLREKTNPNEYKNRAHS